MKKYKHLDEKYTSGPSYSTDDLGPVIDDLVESALGVLGFSDEPADAGPEQLKREFAGILNAAGLPAGRSPPREQHPDVIKPQQYRNPKDPPRPGQRVIVSFCGVATIAIYIGRKPMRHFDGTLENWEIYEMPAQDELITRSIDGWAPTPEPIALGPIDIAAPPKRNQAEPTPAELERRDHAHRVSRSR